MRIKPKRAIASTVSLFLHINLNFELRWYITLLQDTIAREEAWFEREAAANEEALRRTRALLPVGVTGLTVEQLEQRAIEAGSLYPRELALRLKVDYRLG